MADNDPESSHISALVTQWTILRNTASDDQAKSVEAQTKLLLRYQKAVYRYLLAALRDSHLADDAFQNFAMRVVTGKFAHADPAMGPFRHYLKSSLKNLVMDYRRRQSRAATAQDLQHVPDDPREDEQLGREFDCQWRDELLSQCWSLLEGYDAHSKQPLRQALQLKADHPDLSSEQLAAMLTEQTSRGTQYSAAAYRKILQRARQSFVELLIAQVTEAVGQKDEDVIQSELEQLGLLQFCKSAWLRRHA